jgi:hypothetical protein
VTRYEADPIEFEAMGSMQVDAKGIQGSRSESHVELFIKGDNEEINMKLSPENAQAICRELQEIDW